MKQICGSSIIYLSLTPWGVSRLFNETKALTQHCQESRFIHKDVFASRNGRVGMSGAVAY